jgi:hypothetical protein
VLPKLPAKWFVLPKLPAKWFVLPKLPIQLKYVPFIHTFLIATIEFSQKSVKKIFFLNFSSCVPSDPVCWTKGRIFGILDHFEETANPEDCHLVKKLFFFRTFLSMIDI